MTIAEPRMDRMVASVEHVFSWFMSGDWEKHHLDPGVADFTFGNPQELPLPGLVDALRSNAIQAMVSRLAGTPGPSRCRVRAS